MAHIKRKLDRARWRGTQKKWKLNLPAWLKPKLGPLLSKAESKERFFARVEMIYPRTSADYILIEKAYDTAQREFRNVVRDNGDQYFEHLRASALFALVHLRVRDSNIIAAILLHDIWEDFRDRWSFDRLVSEFNKEVAELVYWVTKPAIGGMYKTKADVLRKYHRQLGHAPRKAILVKLCERLHNLITIWEDDAPRTRSKVEETLNFHLTLAEEHCILVHEIEDVLKLIESRLK